MVWVPSPEKDRKAGQYLDHINHAPYEMIVAAIAVSFLAITFTILAGSF